MLWFYRCVITMTHSFCFFRMFNFVENNSLLPSEPCRARFVRANPKIWDGCGLWLLSKKAKAQPSKGRLSRFAICSALLAFQHRERRANCNLPR